MNEFLLNNPWAILLAILATGTAFLMAGTLSIFWFLYFITKPFKAKN